MKLMHAIVLLAVFAAGCGNNLAGPAGTPTLRPPTNLLALSLDSAHVRLFWTPPANASDTTFAGYAISWAGVRDTAPRTAVQFTAGPLPRGATQFSLRSLLKGGTASDQATISWAPAWRFDQPALVITEYNPPQQSGVPGIDAGTASTDPSTVGVTDADADSTMDFYLWGPSGSPLQLVSASIYNPGWHNTVFSTTATSAPDLNVPLASFPADNSFTLQSVTLADNTVYYARIQDNAGSILYIRVHVHLLAGSYPARPVEIRISLQRVPRLPFA